MRIRVQIFPGVCYRSRTGVFNGLQYRIETLRREPLGQERQIWSCRRVSRWEQPNPYTTLWVVLAQEALRASSLGMALRLSRSCIGRKQKGRLHIHHNSLSPKNRLPNSSSRTANLYSTDKLRPVLGKEDCSCIEILGYFGRMEGSWHLYYCQVVKLRG